MSAYEDFLFELARQKYNLYLFLFKTNPSASRTEDCFQRIQKQTEYTTILNVINHLPPEGSKRIREIEREYFNDAAYVSQ